MSEEMILNNQPLTIQQVKEALEKKGHLVFIDDTYNDQKLFKEWLFLKHSIYLSIKEFDKLDNDVKLLLLVASQYPTLEDIAQVSCQTSNYVHLNLLDPIRYIKDQINRVRVYSSVYNNESVIIRLSKNEDDENKIYSQIFFLDFTDSFLQKNGPFNVHSKVKRIPTFVIKRNLTMIQCNESQIKYEYNIDNVFRSLSRRYKFTTDNLRYTNEITDKTKIYSIMDKNIVRAIKHLGDRNALYNRNTVIINPNLSYFAEQYNRQIPLEHLFALFDIDEKELKSNLKKVWYLSNPIVCLGLGGLMSNFLYWCDRFRDYFELDYIFKQLIVFEPDELEFSNLFRIPLNWRDLKVTDKVSDYQLRQFIDEGISDLTYSREYHYKTLLMKSVRNLSPKIRKYEMRFTYINLKNCILIGGPDLKTRKDIFENYSGSDKFFICTTHSNNTFSIDAFPNFDRELTVETYGSIDLNKFLLNMFKMTIEVIKILANKEFLGKVQHKYLDYSVDNEDFIANSQKHKCLKNIAYAIN